MAELIQSVLGTDTRRSNTNIAGFSLDGTERPPVQEAGNCGTGGGITGSGARGLDFWKDGDTGTKRQTRFLATANASGVVRQRWSLVAVPKKLMVYLSAPYLIVFLMAPEPRFGGGVLRFQVHSTQLHLNPITRLRGETFPWLVPVRKLCISYLVWVRESGAGLR